MNQTNEQQSTAIPEGQPVAQKSRGCLWIIIGVAVLAVVFVFGLLIIWLLLIRSETTPEPGTNSNPTATPGFNSSGSVDLGLPNLNRSSVKTQSARQVDLSEVELASEALKILQRNNWNGNSRDLKMSAADIPQSTWDRWKTTQEQRRNGLTIPNPVLSLYTSTQAQDEIKAAVPKIRGEYLAYIKAQGVSDRYIEEINQRVLPQDASRYLFHFENDLSSNPTSVEGISTGGDKDYTKLQMHLSVIDFNNGARIFRESGVIADPQNTPFSDMAVEKQLRDLGMRWYIYHEMTHVLQRAYLNLHADPADANSLAPYSDPRKTTMLADDKYFWKWGMDDPWESAGQNYDVAMESQAEGISFEALTRGYNLSPAQKEAAWEHMFGRLKNAQGLLDQIKTTFETKYPEVFPQDFDNYLDNALESDAGSNADLIFSLTTRLTLMPSYVGYAHPMLPQDTGKFWGLFK